MTDWIFIQWMMRGFRLVHWCYRKIGISDFVTALSLFMALGLLILINLSQQFVYTVGLINLPEIVRQFVFITTCLVGLLSVVFGVHYVYRLRTIGIASVDGSAESGLDYRSALASINEGFDFVGIAGAKLTQQNEELRRAVVRMSQHHKQVRILLCDPRSSVISALERTAGVDTGSYRTTVMQSFSLLQHLQTTFPETLLIRLYRAADEQSLFPFRMMFINGDFCLISNVVIGAPKQGKLIPQLHLQKKPLGDQMPNFYSACFSLFCQAWNAAAAIESSDFDEIAQLNVVGERLNRNG
jgi:hypothetical protein